MRASGCTVELPFGPQEGTSPEKRALSEQRLPDGLVDCNQGGICSALAAERENRPEKCCNARPRAFAPIRGNGRARLDVKLAEKRSSHERR